MPRLCMDSTSSGYNSSVSLHVSGLPRCAAAHQLTQLKYDRISNVVEDTVARTLAAHEPRVEEDLEMFRYVRLISFQGLDDLVDGHCFTLKCLQDAQAARFPEDLESAGDHLDHLLVDHRLSSTGCGSS